MEMMKKGEWLDVHVPNEWKDIRIETLLTNTWQVPRGLLHELRTKKGVILDGKALPWNTVLQPGQRLSLHLFRPEEDQLVPDYMNIEPVYEDDHLLIVNKPFAMDTHPNEPGQTGTLANRVAYHFLCEGISTKVRHIHRLDRDTTGGVLFAKHPLAGAIMDRMLQERKISRTYIAFVEGICKQNKGIIDAPIGRDRHHPIRRRVSTSGQHALTRFKVLHRFPKSQITLMEFNLETGRTHQIRVHMSYQGHPLVGDLLYGGKNHLLGRQALHAAHISLDHPLSGESIHVPIPWPLDLLELQNRLS